MDYMGRTYDEERHAPGYQRKALTRIKAKHTVPALLVDNKDTYPESLDILKWIDTQLLNVHPDLLLFPTDATDPVKGQLIRDFCARCDADLAPEALRFFFYHLTGKQFFEICTDGVPESEKSSFKWMAPFARPMFNYKLKINAHSYKDSIRYLGKFLDNVDHLLSDGRKFLFFDRLTAADITFCSLAAFLVCPPEFGGAKLPYDTLPDELRSEVDRIRQTKVGTYIRAIYKVFRKKSVGDLAKPVKTGKSEEAPIVGA